MQSKRQADTRYAIFDTIRGAMLTLVFVDHLDASSGGRGGIRDWTLIGLGFSDASDVFIFVSGLLLGMSFERKVSEVGAKAHVKALLLRVLAVYLHYAGCAICVIVFDAVAHPAQGSDVLLRIFQSLAMMKQPMFTGILCAYVLMLPWVSGLQSLFGRNRPAELLGVSLAVYLLGHLAFHLNIYNIATWSFNPLCWQLLMVTASALGQRVKGNPELLSPKSWRLFGLSVFVLLFSVVIRKHEALQDLLMAKAWCGSCFVSEKAVWPLTRAIHLLSLIYTLLFLAPPMSRFWSSSLFWPLRVCGRHSLIVYSFGVLLANFTPVFFQYAGVTRENVLLLVFPLICMQLGLAVAIDKSLESRTR